MTSEAAAGNRLLLKLSSGQSPDERDKTCKDFCALTSHVAVDAMQSRAEASVAEGTRAVKALLESSEPAVMRLVAM